MFTAAQCAEIANIASTPPDDILEKCLQRSQSIIVSLAQAGDYSCDIPYGIFKNDLGLGLKDQNRPVVINYLYKKLNELGFQCNIILDIGAIRVSWAHALKKRQDRKEGE